MKMMKLIGAVGAVAVMNSGVVHAAEGISGGHEQGKTIKLTCESSGPAMSSLGQSQADLEADIKFTVKVRQDGLRVIEKFRGSISLESGQSASETLIAKFNDEKALENPDYRPRVYKGYSQFRNINAQGVSGSQEMAMVGSFLLEQRLDKSHVHGVYQFQAGDSMGGVLHLTCKKTR